MSPTRRNVLKAGAGMVTASGFAGCLNAVGLGDDEIDADGYAIFFALHDWAEQVGGEELSFINPVGTGKMGHGWSPDANITSDVASTDMFIYLDTPEFDWARSIATNLERDYDDIAIVDLLDGLEPYLIDFDSDGGDQMPEPDNSLTLPQEDLSEFDIWDLRSQTQLGYWHRSRDHWHGGLPAVQIDASLPVGIALKDSEERVLPLGAEETYRVDARTVGGDEDAVDIEIDGSTVEFQGNALGEADIVFEIYRGDELVYDTANDLTTISVVEEIESDGQFHDPHTWLDPVIVQDMIDTLTTEFAALDPDNADVYEENAAEYKTRIQGVHEEFETMVDDAELDFAIFAGHDSYGYVERRYGFDLQTPVGVSPDASASRGDIIGLIETIDENGIDTILYDPFETTSPGESYPDIVESILEESNAEHAEPLTPISGTTEEWDENGWGWIDQMEQINIPSLEAALNPN